MAFAICVECGSQVYFCDDHVEWESTLTSVSFAVCTKWLNQPCWILLLKKIKPNQIMLDYFISFAMLDLTLINKSLYFMLPVYIMIAKIYLNIFH